MKKLFTLAFILFCAAAAQAQRAPAGAKGAFRVGDKREGHTSRLVLRVGAFDATRHRITHGKRLDLPVLEVDGRMALGVDDFNPSAEIKSFEFYFDGRRVAVPRRLYSDCFNPNFGKDYFA